MALKSKHYVSDAPLFLPADPRTPSREVCSGNGEFTAAGSRGSDAQGGEWKFYFQPLLTSSLGEHTWTQVQQTGAVDASSLAAKQPNREAGTGEGVGRN